MYTSMMSVSFYTFIVSSFLSNFLVSGYPTAIQLEQDANRSLVEIQPLTEEGKLFKPSLQKRLDPDSDTFEFHQYQSPVPHYEDMDADDREVVRTALTHVDTLTRAALAVGDDDPLWTLYFGQNTPETRDIVRQVFGMVANLHINAQGNGAPVRFVRFPQGPNDEQFAMVAEPNYDEIRLLPRWFDAPEFGHEAQLLLPIGPLDRLARDPDAEPMTADTRTQGAILLHELIHFVTTQEYPGGPPNPIRPFYERLERLRMTRMETEVRLPFYGAIDIRPLLFLQTAADQRILLRMGEYARGLAYGYNVATGMATMTHGPLLTVMNADSYNLFATAALFNRRQGTNVEANAGALQNAPSIYEQMGLFNVDGALIPGRFLDMDQRLVRLLRTLLLYRTVGALGKVRMF